MNSKTVSILFLMGLIFFGASRLAAQIAVRIAVDRETYLLYEQIYAKVELRNYSGRTIVFGESEEIRGELDFVVTQPDGQRAPKRKTAPRIMSGVVLSPGATEELLVPLSRIYSFEDAGRYSMKGVISHPMMPNSYESNLLFFNVINGIPVWERIVGMPDIMNEREDDTVVARRARILTFYDGRVKMYCLMIDDNTHVYGVIRLGRDIGHFPPQCEVDGLSRIHALIQISPQIFSYFIFDLNADLDEKEVFARADTAPQLVRDPEQGTVTVVGGKRAQQNIDYTDQEGVPVLPAPQNEPR